MRRQFTALLLSVLTVCTVYTSQAEAGRFTLIISTAASSTTPTPVPNPTPAPSPSTTCPDCNGTGQVGDGVVNRICKTCNGTGELVSVSVKAAAGAQPTPWTGVAMMLNTLKPAPNEVLLDPGCGADARLLITAVRFFNVEKAIGIEIDPVAAESARKAVADAGLSQNIEIITGDSTQLDIQADVGVAYMWPAVLQKLRPKILRMRRFVTYGFPVPGLQMAQNGYVYSWQPAPVVVTQTRTVQHTVSLPRGSYCQVCGRRCGNPMAHVLQQVVVPASPVATGHYQRVCRNGHCSYVWVED